MTHPTTDPAPPDPGPGPAAPHPTDPENPADPDTLPDALARSGRSPTLLIACDYDGTLAPIVNDPARAFPLREAIAAIRGLANLADTHVAVISGRSLRDLAVLSRLPLEVHLVGSHGSEFEPHSTGRLDPEQTRLLERLGRELTELAAAVPGCSLESKPSGVAFHYRQADPADGARAAARVLAGPGKIDGVRVREGKKVVELSVVATDKGGALDQLRHQLGADTVVFIGDDVTDEDAFARLRGPDVGIKVGPEASLARYRVTDEAAVADLLGRLFEERSAWLAGHRAPPIERHNLLSDQHTVALVDPEGRLTWMCHPRADGQSLFAELLGGPAAGFFAVRPVGTIGPPTQRYLPDTMVLETRWPSHRVVDYLDIATSQRDTTSPDDPGHDETPISLVRTITGNGPVEVSFAPRLDFGRIVTELVPVTDGVAVIGGPEAIAVHAPGVRWEVAADGRHHTARAMVDPQQGPVNLELRIGGGTPADEPERRRVTTDFWIDIADRLVIPPVAAPSVRRSALVLEALRFAPSGALLAAATTSLPETVGGVRNWDYRYCWPRDAAMACASLARLGRVEPGIAFLDWLCDRAEHATRADLLRPLYRVCGDDQVPEATIAELAGYAGSRPVRIGNAAENQVQHDTFGPVLDLIHQLFVAGGAMRPRHWMLAERIVEVVLERWMEPDHGIWEIRLARQHNVVSKVMCWLVLDRAVKLAWATGREVPERWLRVRQEIVDEVMTRGFDSQRGTFVSSYDAGPLDAALLLLGICGFIEPTDPRFSGTIRAIEAELCEGTAVFRYRHDDGLPGEEGGFLICSGWLVQALAANGRVDEAVDRFDQLLAAAGPTGLLPEQIDPVSERRLGNHPQAYSHLAVIDCAVALAAHGVRG